VIPAGVTGEIPISVLSAAAFAESLALQYEQRGGNPRDLFTALAGLVSLRDKVVSADCLIALEGALLKDEEA